MSIIIDKSVKSMMRKLTNLALKLDNLELDVSLKIKFDSIWLTIKFDSIWLTSEHAACLIGTVFYTTIIYLPKTDLLVNKFEQEIENQIDYLKKESKKLTKEGNE